jgi:hypothetical protein
LLAARQQLRHGGIAVTATHYVGEQATLGTRIRTSPEERTDNHPDGGKESLMKALIAFLLLASSALADTFHVHYSIRGRTDREAIQAPSDAFHGGFGSHLDRSRKPLGAAAQDGQTLSYQERGTPVHRRNLKRQKYAELDRLKAHEGYTNKNTRLVHHECHIADQRKKGCA